MDVKRVILLNPPAEGVVIRDYFCSKSSQAGYINPPIDFVIQSGMLAARFDVKLVDAVVEKLTPGKCAAKIRSLDPDAIIALTGVVSWREDVEFFKSLGARRLILIGDIFLENPERRLAESPFAEAFLLDFSTGTPAKYLLGERGGLSGIVYRGASGEIVSLPADFTNKLFSIPVPKHELFMDLDYRYPFVLGSPFATVLTEYGCPHKCGFCVMGQLGHKERPVEDVVQELGRLNKLGIRDIFFMDQTFGSNRARMLELLEELEAFSPLFRWLCFSRADRADRDVVTLMRRAGCHTIIYGIESDSDETLGKYNKGYTWRQIKESFAAAKRAGVRTVGTLVFGLPGDTVKNCRSTIESVKTLQCDYISINIAAPRMGSPMRADAVAKGIVDSALDRMDQSGSFIVMEHGEFTAETVMELKRKAIREFYFRPAWLIRRLAAITSPGQLKIEARQGLALLNNYLKGR